MKIQPKNWQRFQHYKDRKPPWIRLYYDILDDYEYHKLPIASKALSPLLWLLASEFMDGIIEASEEKIAFRLRISVKELREGIKHLISSGFFVSYQDASNSLATR